MDFRYAFAGECVLQKLYTKHLAVCKSRLMRSVLCHDFNAVEGFM